MLEAAILIGGRARRLDGAFKPLLPIGERRILERQIDAVRAAGIENIALIGNWNIDERPPLPVFADAIEAAGSLGALYTALLVTTAERTIVLAGDMPFVAPALVAALGQTLGKEDVVVPRSADGRHPLCAGYRRSVAMRLKSRIDRGALRVRDALEDLEVRELGLDQLMAIDADNTMLMNVNTPADYERARTLAHDRA